jgi:NodT family efflux transporter outer membrane factor (OMF) lipoprotein
MKRRIWLRSAAGIAKRGALTAAVLAAAACSTMPSERPETPVLPAAWTDAPVGADIALSEWWRKFNDPDLTRFVAEALANGPSLQLAASRIDEARGQSRSTVAQYLPQLTLTGQGQYSRSVGSDVPESEFASASYGPQVSWEIPLFAQIEAAVVGARANEQMAQADYRAARVALAADTAQAYVDYRAARASYAALSQSVQSADELARILETSAQAGFVSLSDAADARRLAESTRARLPGLVIESRRAENALAILRGVTPGTESSAAQAVLAEPNAAVPYLPLNQAPAAPADFLRLRPDVARAEANALLAAAALGTARAQLLPRLNLTGSLLSTETILGVGLSPDGQSVSATPFISIPLFDWGQRLGQIRINNARFDQSLIQYRQTVLQAVGEGSLSLTSLEQGRQRLNSSRLAEQAAEATLRGSRAAYDAGIQSLADRLRAEQQVIDARLSRIDAERAQASAAIATYRAFGGGAV